MSPGQIAKRREWVLGDRVQKRNPGSNRGFWLHQRGYHLGDIRCCKCDKWINPSNPEEAKEIVLSPAGRQLHHKRYCDNPAGNGGSSNFSRVPKHSGGRRRSIDDAKRY